MPLLEAVLTGQLMAVALVFARIGTALMVLPGFGEVQIPARVRLLLGLVVSLGLAPATPVPPVPPSELGLVAGTLGAEVTIGLWIGLSGRTLLAALHFAGSQIALTAGLSNAFAAGPGAFEGSTAIAGFLLIAATAAIFATDTHHLMIRALLYSYDILPFGRLMLADMAREFTRVVSGSLYLGLTLAAPFFVMGLLLNLGLGLANRMMASLPVFFVAASGLIAAGFFVLALAVPAILDAFVARFAEWLGRLSF